MNWWLKIVPVSLFETPTGIFPCAQTLYSVSRAYFLRRAVLVLTLKSLDLICFMTTCLRTKSFTYNKEITAHPLSLIDVYYTKSANLGMRHFIGYH